MSFFVRFVIMILYSCPETRCDGRYVYDLLYNSKKLPDRMLVMMSNYAGRMEQKMDEVHHVRAKYEVSPHFEMGYVMGEVMEKYRKMVGLVQRSRDFKSDAVYDTLKRTELVQQLFLEILHLMYMVHEIRQKYKHKKEFEAQVKVEKNATIDTPEDNKKYRDWVMKQQAKELKKARDFIKKGFLQPSNTKTVKKNKWWPIDYGWEIDIPWW